MSYSVGDIGSANRASLHLGPSLRDHDKDGAAGAAPGRPLRGIRAHALVLAATVLLGSLVGCSATAPRIDVLTPLPAGVDPPLFVTAARQKDAIVRSLQAAGFRMADAPGPGVYLMRVTIGVSQDFRPCGTLNNVRYALRDRQVTLIVAEAKGWTGICEPNVFDDVGRALRARVVSSISEGSQ